MRKDQVVDEGKKWARPTAASPKRYEKREGIDELKSNKNKANKRKERVKT